MNIVFLDIETSPNIAYSWGKWEQNIPEFLENWYIMCFAVKWNRSRTKVYKKIDYKTYKQFIKELWDVFDKADIIVAHNGDNFDIKKSNSAFIECGLKPPSPYKTIDTLKWARRHFKFDSNKLDDLGEYLSLGRKLETGGFKLWKECMRGDIPAYNKMARYNKRDVDLLYKVYEKIKCWSNNHPNINVFSGKNACPVCGSTQLQRRGFSISKTGKTQRLCCQKCGSWCSEKTIKTVKIK